MPRARPVVLLLALLTLAAGCVAPASDEGSDAASALVDASWAERALPFGDDHDHFDPAHHQGLSTPNFELLGWDPLVSPESGETPGGHFCGDARARADGRTLAVVNSFYSGVAFVLADVTDPARPFYVGELSLPWKQGVYDVAMSPDGMYVVVGATQEMETPAEGLVPTLGADATLPGPLSLMATWRDGCTGHERAVPWLGPLPQGPGTILVDIADPTQPVIVDFQSAPVLGPHSLTTSEIDGTTYVCVAVTNLAQPASFFQFFELTGGKLELLSVYQEPQTRGQKQPVITGHVDAIMAKHPVTEQLIAYVADWDNGVILLDMADPKLPKRLSTFTTYEGNGGSYQTGQETGNFHEAVPIEGLWDGRHYVIAGQEILNHPEASPTGWVWILDDTDPTDLKPVGRWTLPVDVQWDQSLQFSTHYVWLVNRTAFVSMYHGGLWAFDLSTPEALALPPTVGVFVPANVSPAAPEVGGPDVVGNPTVMEAYPLPGGELVVFDAQSGVYTVRFHPEVPVPSPAPWPGSELVAS